MLFKQCSEIVRRIEAQGNGRFCDRKPLAEQDFCLFYFQVVDECPGGTVRFFFELALKTGEGKAASGGDFFQLDRLAEMVMDIENGLLNIFRLRMGRVAGKQKNAVEAGDKKAFFCTSGRYVVW